MASDFPHWTQLSPRGEGACAGDFQHGFIPCQPWMPWRLFNPRWNIGLLCRENNFPSLEPNMRHRPNSNWPCKRWSYTLHTAPPLAQSSYYRVRSSMNLGLNLTSLVPRSEACIGNTSKLAKGTRTTCFCRRQRGEMEKQTSQPVSLKLPMPSRSIDRGICLSADPAASGKWVATWRSQASW